VLLFRRFRAADPLIVHFVRPQENAMSNNVDKLHKAGITDANNLTPEEKQLLETLTTQEIETLLSIKRKLGDKMIKHSGGAVKPHFL
jgi:hypothetical protein